MLRPMPPPLDRSSPVRWGLWLLPLAGVLLAVVFTLGMVTPADPERDFEQYAAATVSPLGVGGATLYLMGLIVLLLGLVALWGWLSARLPWRWAVAGLVLSLVSVGLLLAAFGAATLGSLVVAAVYLAGHPGVRDALTPLTGGHFSRYILAYLLAGIVLGLGGAVANSVALWRSESVARWVAVLFGLGFLLIVVSFPVATQLGGILLAIAGTVLALRVGRARPL